MARTVLEACTELSRPGQNPVGKCAGVKSVELVLDRNAPRPDWQLVQLRTRENPARGPCELRLRIATSSVGRAGSVPRSNGLTSQDKD
jgi:hypothetical protein